VTTAALQNGWYLQAIYQFMPMWRVGARYDRLDSGTPRIGQVESGGLSAADFPILQARGRRATSLMFDFSPSEFSRFPPPARRRPQQSRR
jgi:hypothetical protein